ncbi:MAG TPA: HD domain-containing phosphohydrolase [Baekduia sp.]|uniref:HD-GYP domain-containing protein n=1 Tax=Baekduia sp. TaxID=2600305 RepID=UPI002D76B9E8|nr:HD domain-containing phosphohydrolase [Baekduia sp.]HET6508655.1 HD domain-containing phosphohydrolase [Baekduia sp.]
MTESQAAGRPQLAAAIAWVGIAVSLGFAVADPGKLDDPLWIALLACAIGSRLVAVDLRSTIFISGAFLCGILAAGFLGPAGAFVLPVAAELVGWSVERYRPLPLLINVAGTTLPTVLAAVAFRALDLDHESAGFAIALAVASCAVLLVNIVSVDLDRAIAYATPLSEAFKPPVHLFPAFALNIALVTGIGSLYAQTGFAVIALVLVALVAFTYMTRLVMAARERTREYANLSWGVLSGLIRTLDARDHRAARHCAAVARFARDIAAHVGMSERDQELAHTAGLLHDIGRFALSDRVMERGVVLTEDDWTAIRRHPELGADMLRDIGVYGPISEIIVAHHERPDGKGYPHRLTADEIPEIAKIIAVAEVYDTLTAPDTYRTRLSSFEALTELRRVAGKQLDAGYVEALAELLAGQGTDYRHADAADYDEELAIERRMNEAAGG